MQWKSLWFGASLFASLGGAHALMLGNTNVPKDKIIVYLLIGHSNMAGHVTTGTDGVTAPRIWNYEWFSSKTWVPAKETPGNLANGLSGKGEGGPGMSFLKDMAAAYPGYNFGVVSNAAFSATLRGLNTGHNGSGTPADSNRYWTDAHLYKEIVMAAKMVQKDVTFGGVLCMLGTVDATRTDEATCRNFGNDAVTMVTSLRADLGEPKLPFIIGEYEHGASGAFSLSLLWPHLVDSCIKSIPSKLELSATVNSVGIEMLDDHHYTLTDKGRPEWSRRTVAIIQSKGWVPPPSAATYVAAPKAKAGAAARRTIYFAPKTGLEIFASPEMAARLFEADGKSLSILPLTR